MTIYVTQFDEATKQCTSISTDSGFESLEAVKTAMGPAKHEYKAMLIYDGGVLFSKLAFNIDDTSTTR